MPEATYPPCIEFERADGERQPVNFAVDCSASNPAFDDACHMKPYWVVQQGQRYKAACPVHLGRVVGDLLDYETAESQPLTFHRYRGE